MTEVLRFRCVHGDRAHVIDQFRETVLLEEEVVGDEDAG